jgi:murein DD-endopeptidase MepM/ murein hydrolase activator NlpD
MANEFYTLIVVPHAKARFRKFQVSVKLVKWTGITAAVLGLFLAAMVVHYTTVAYQVRRLRNVEQANQELSIRNKQFEASTAKLQAQVVTLQSMVTKLGVMAGLDQLPPDAAVGGVGGLSSVETTAPQTASPESLRKMENSVSLLTERSKALTEFYQDRGTLLASTPSVWPVRGYLSASFGNRNDPFTGQRDFHTGIDISTPTGTRVQAPADGLVVSCGLKGGYGNAVVIDHGFGVVTRYAHLDHFNVKPGQRVRRGDVIAFVGSTGKSTAPHLHYEVWVNDQAQNPIQYILDEYRSFG